MISQVEIISQEKINKLSVGKFFYMSIYTLTMLDTPEYQQLSDWDETMVSDTNKQLKDLHAEITQTQKTQQEGGVKEQQETQEEDWDRIERISSNLKTAFDNIQWANTVSWNNFIQRCRHESGDFYTGAYSNKRLRNAYVVCKGHPKGKELEIKIDRNASDKALSTIPKTNKSKWTKESAWKKETQLVTRDGNKIYGWYNYTNVSSNSISVREQPYYGYMESADIVYEGKNQKTVQFPLYIFASDQHFVDTMITRLQQSGVTNQDDMMTMMAKLSGMTWFNGYSLDNIVRYANSGLLRWAKNHEKDSDTLKIAVPYPYTFSQVRKIMRSQLDNNFMNHLSEKCPELYAQYDAFFKLPEKDLNESKIATSKSTYQRGHHGAQEKMPPKDQTYDIVTLKKLPLAPPAQTPSKTPPKNQNKIWK